MYQTQRKFDQQRGIDLKSTDFTRGDNYATIAKNLDFLKSGAQVKRYGHQRAATYGIGKYGIVPYQRDAGETTLGDIPYESTLIALDKTPKKRMTVTLTVSRAADATLTGAYLSLYFDVSTAQFRCRIYEFSEASGEVEKFNLGLGTGEESPAYSVETLKNLINAVTGYTATVDGDGNLASAAFLAIVREHQLLSATGGSAAALEAYYFTALNTTLTDPLANTTDLISAVELNRVLYMANGQDYLTKYDGQTCYRAGMPQAVGGASLSTMQPGLTGTNYTYRGRYVQKDAAGNFIEGNFSDPSEPVSPTNDLILVNFPPIAVGTGFNTNRAKVNGNQTGATITVDAGHTMKVGDTAFLIDRDVSSGVGEERRVLAITSTTLTFHESIKVNDNDMISNNLRLEIYRSKSSGSTPTVWYFHSEVPNGHLVDAILDGLNTLSDTTPDDDLGDELLEAIADHGRPPNGARYLSVFNNHLMIVGVTPDVEQDYLDMELSSEGELKSATHPHSSAPLRTEASLLWSDVDGPEYFPWDGSTEVLVNAKDGKALTGGGPSADGNFAALKNPGVFVLTGDLTNNQNIRVDQVSEEIGCASHHTVRSIPGGLAFLDERLGPHRMSGSQVPQPLGAISDESGQIFGRLEPIFSMNYTKVASERFDFSKATGIYVPKQNKYLVNCPILSEAADGSDFDNGNGVIFAYDFARDAWLEWYALNAFGGFAVFEDSLWWMRREQSGSGTVGKLDRQLDLLDAWAYQDHASPIEWDIGPQWQFLGEPSIFKKCTDINIFSNEEIPYNDGRVTVQTEVNFTPGAALTNSEIMVPGDGYGGEAYGLDHYGAPLAPDTGLKLSSGRFLSLRPRFRDNTAQSTPVISGYDLFFATPYKVKLKK